MHANLIICGTVNSGKSTISSMLLKLSGAVDERTLSRISQLSWVMDTSENERATGNTVDCASADFQTTRRSYTILDAPGHKNYIPNAISGAMQADIAVLVVSARKGEFEAGFLRDGQTREHALLVRAVGVSHIVVAVNKMDDPTVDWDEARFDSIQAQLASYLKTIGFANVTYVTISGLTGANMFERHLATKPCLIEILDSLTIKLGDPTDILRMPISNEYRDMGSLFLSGRIESGTVRPGQTVYFGNTENVAATVFEVIVNDNAVAEATSGFFVVVKIKGDYDAHVGDILASTQLTVTRQFTAQVQFFRLKSLVCAGYKAVIHIHSATVEATVEELKTAQFVRSNSKATVVFTLDSPVYVTKYAECNRFGRFILRDENATVAAGIVV